MNLPNEWLWIEPGQIQFSKEEGEGLRASWKGKEGPVKVNRLFPITQRDSCISISDLEGKEWGVLRTITGLEASSYHALLKDLLIRPYLPNIKRINALRRRFNQFNWEIETDYGDFSLLTGPVYEVIVILQNGSRLLTDLDDQKYVIPSDPLLDKASRKLLAKWL